MQGNLQSNLWNTAGLGESFLDGSLQEFFLGKGALSAVKTRKVKTKSADNFFFLVVFFPPPFFFFSY